jgi:uncharacterized protein YjbI with pentapeptide repeats
VTLRGADLDRAVMEAADLEGVDFAGVHNRVH